MAGMSFITSCKKWLEVEPVTQITQEKLFTSEKGYFDALTGLYVKLRQNYNPNGFFVAGDIEYMGNVYNVIPQSNAQYINSHDYTSTFADASLGGAFLNQYNSISATNTLLEGIDQYGKADILSEKARKIVQGEALAMRAFLHFDLIRLWGPIPKNVDSKAYLPYAKSVQIRPLAYYTYDEYMTNLLADLDTAESLLLEIDPILKYTNSELNSSSNAIGEYKGQAYFWRQNRLNYYAVLALKARVYAWMGNQEKAVFYSKAVIDARNGSNTAKFRLGIASDLTAKDYSLFSEHIFGLYIQLYDDQIAFNSRFSPYFQLVGEIAELYPDAGDFRKNNFYNNLNYGVNQNVNTSSKYAEMRFSTSPGKFSVPIIRLAEMYLIISEFSPLEQANSYYLTFQQSRGIKNYVTLTDENRTEVVIKEYYREFFSEGQIFFANKRLKRTQFRWTDKLIGELQYVPPLPVGETGMRDLFQ